MWISHSRSVVANTESLEVSFSVKVIDGFQRNLVWHCTVRSVKIPHVQGSKSLNHSRKILVEL